MKKFLVLKSYEGFSEPSIEFLAKGGVKTLTAARKMAELVKGTLCVESSTPDMFGVVILKDDKPTSFTRLADF